MTRTELVEVLDGNSLSAYEPKIREVIKAMLLDMYDAGYIAGQLSILHPKMQINTDMPTEGKPDA